METNTQPKIFLSYARVDTNVADEIDNTFKSIGITFSRDVRDVNYTSSFKDFMNTIGKNDFVVMVISDEYVKSENCMYEVTELLNTHEFEKRILPVIVNKAPVFKSDGHELYYDYWQQQVEDKKRLWAKHANEKTIEDKKKVEDIYNYLGLFFQKISDLNSVHFDDLRIQNYKPMLQRIGINKWEENLIEQLLEIDKIDDEEEQEIQLEDLREKNPYSINVLFSLGNNAIKHKKYRKAKLYYERIIDIAPSISLSYVKIADLLNEHFQDYIKAKEYYEKAISLSPIDIVARYNFALLCTESLKDYTLAQLHYSKIIEINPRFEKAYTLLANILEINFKEYKQANILYEKLMKINSNYSDSGTFKNWAINHYHLEEYEKANEYYNKAAEIDSSMIEQYCQFANLLFYRGEMEYALTAYKNVIKLSPENREAKKSVADMERGNK